MEVLPSGVDKIRVICKQRRIRLVEFFATFDSRKTKKCTAAQFERALDTAGVKRVLSVKDPDVEQTISELVSYYTLPQDPLMIDYLRFCDQVNEVTVACGSARLATPVSARLDCGGERHRTFIGLSPVRSSL